MRPGRRRPADEGPRFLEHCRVLAQEAALSGLVPRCCQH